LPTLTLQGFDGRRLADLFARLARAGGGRRVIYRNARTGATVLPEPEALASGELEVSRELRQLAAHCRGNPAVAWRYWRQRLRTEPESDQGQPARDRNRAAPKRQGRISCG
jgi:hypothetical protein